MALNYLLSPEFQIVNTAGRPATGGYLEVFIHGSRERYYCASDFNGTLYPFQVPLDSLGGNVVLADDSNAYDVYAYNRYGSLLMSRYNVHPSSGGSMGGIITSTDGSVTVTATEDGYDLSVSDNKASTLKAAADTLYEDGYYSFRFKEGAGDQITIQNGSIILQDGWYHFSATVKLDWAGINVNQTDQLKLYSALTYDIIDFDYSYNHVDTIMLDGDIYIAPSSTQYISFGRTFTLAVLGMHQGLSAELVDLDIHSITGHGFAGGGEKNIHRLLRYYTNASEADEQHPVGDWLHDLDADDPADPSRHPMVTADQLFAWYAAGQIFELYEVDGTNGQLGWSAVYRMVTWQDQSDWWSQYAETPGKAVRLEFFRMGMYSSPYCGGLIAYIRYKDEDYMRLYEIMPGQSIWMAEYQEKLPHYASDWHAGDFLRVKQDGSDLEWVPLSGVALSGSYNDLSDVPANLVQDADYVHTDNNFTDNDKDKLDNIEAGAEVNVQSDWTETDSSDDAYIKHKPGTKPVAAGDNITITETASQFVISAADQQQANWNEADTDSAQYIQNKPDLSVYATTQDMNTALAGKQDVISDLATIRSGAALGATATQPADLAAGLATKQDVISDLATIRSGAALGATSVQPADLAPYATTSDMNTALAGKQDVISDLATIRSGAALGATSVQPSDLATVATTGSYDDLTDKPVIPAAQVQADWSESDSTSVSYIQNKPDLSVYATDSELTAGLATKQDTISDLSDIRSGAALGATAVQPGDLATVASTGAYDDLLDKPTIPSGVQLVPAATASDADKVLTVNSIGIPEWAESQGLFIAQYGTTSYDDIDAAARAGKIVYCYVNGRFAFLAYTNTAGADRNYEFQYYRSASSGTDSVFIYKVRPAGSTWGPEWETTQRTVKAGNISYPVTQVNVNGASAMTGTVANITIPEAPTVDQTYDASSSNAQSGTAVAGAISTKQDTISDLSTIRSGAALGATAVQPGDLATVAVSGSYNDLLNQPHIPVIGTITL